jgi:hypothetical protein
MRTEPSIAILARSPAGHAPKQGPKTMICPHCNTTIREEQRYLMSSDGEAKWPTWAGPAMWVLLFLFVVATLALFSHLVAT